ncbi:MAG: hypothetical protein ACE149_06815 [Armatimonadota bacterium]
MANTVERYAGDGMTPAELTYNEGSISDGAATTPRRIWWKNASTAGEALSNCRCLREQLAGNDGYDFLEIAPDVPVPPPAAAHAAPAAGIALEIGYYEYAVTFVTANGETTAGVRCSVTTTSGNQHVDLTTIPIGPAGTVARRLYRTEVGAVGDLLLVAEIADNAATTYHDETADVALGVPAPALNTSGSPGAWQTGPLALGDLAVGDHRACWMRFTFPAGTSQIGNPRQAYVRFEEAA